jgi:hypothetical protein
MRKHDKKPKIAFNPSSEKIPRQKEDANNFLTMRPSWQISRIDEEGRWGWNNIRAEDFKNEFIPKIRNFESNTWAQILGDKSHEVLISEIDKAAQKRLTDLKLLDIETLVSLRLAGKKRVWGIRNAAVFKILWWDPEHEVYPSVLRHT